MKMEQALVASVIYAVGVFSKMSSYGYFFVNPIEIGAYHLKHTKLDSHPMYKYSIKGWISGVSTIAKHGQKMRKIMYMSLLADKDAIGPKIGRYGHTGIVSLALPDYNIPKFMYKTKVAPRTLS